MRVLIIRVAVDEHERHVGDQFLVFAVLAALQLRLDGAEVHRLLNHVQVVRYLRKPPVLGH